METQFVLTLLLVLFALFQGFTSIFLGSFNQAIVSFLFFFFKLVEMIVYRFEFMNQKRLSQLARLIAMNLQLNLALLWQDPVSTAINSLMF